MIDTKKFHDELIDLWNNFYNTDEVYDIIFVEDDYIEVKCENKKVANQFADYIMAYYNAMICYDFRKGNGCYQFSISPSLMIRESKKSIKESVEFFNDFGTGVYCATSSNGWTFCYCPLSWINKKGVEDLIGWSVMDDKAHYIEGDSWENKTDEEINDSIDNFEKLIKKYAKEDAKEIIKDFRSTLDKD